MDICRHRRPVQMGYYDGYVFVYDPITYFITNLIDLMQKGEPAKAQRTPLTRSGVRFLRSEGGVCCLARELDAAAEWRGLHRIADPYRELAGIMVYFFASGLQ